MSSPAGSAVRLALSRAQASRQRVALTPSLSQRPKGTMHIHIGASTLGRRMSTVVQDHSIESAHVPPPPPRPLDSATVSVETGGPTSDVLKRAFKATTVRNDWTKQEIAAIYNHPLMDLAFQA